MNKTEAQEKAQKVLVKGSHLYNEAQAGMIKNDVVGATFGTRSGKLVEVVEQAPNNNIIIKSGDEYDAVAGVWFISHIERGSFVKK